MVEVMFLGAGPELTYGDIYNLKEVILTPVGPYGIVTQKGRVIAGVPMGDLCFVHLCPECGGWGTFVWSTTEPAIDPNDPYGEPIPVQVEHREVCTVCGGSGRVIS